MKASTVYQSKRTFALFSYLYPFSVPTMKPACQNSQEKISFLEWQTRALLPQTELLLWAIVSELLGHFCILALFAFSGVTFALFQILDR